MAAGPLDRIRIIDLTRVWAGPLATRILGDLGADVIKIEQRDARGAAVIPPAASGQGLYPNGDPGEQPYNRQGSFNKLNRNKRSLVLDLQSPEGVALFKQLVAVSDVVVDNFSARVMTKLGLGYDVLSAINPGIIMLSMPGFGTTGPYRDFVSYGPVIEPMSGLQSVMGYNDTEVRATSVALPDAIGGTHAAAAIMTALWQRSETGDGSFVELSQHEAGINMLGEVMLGYQLDGQPPTRHGNRHPAYAPSGVYRCAGQDEWVYLAVRDDEEFARLCRIIDRPDWLNDPRLIALDARQRYHDMLDEGITAWTAQRTKHDVMQQLQAAGIPAGAALTGPELLADPHLQARRFFATLDHTAAGPTPYPGLPVAWAADQHATWHAAPLLGEHNRAVLHDLLGEPDGRVEQLQAAGIIADRPAI